MSQLNTIAVRPLRAADAPDWRALWEAYLAFYQSRVDEAVFDATFARLLDDDPRSHRALVAESTSGLVGLVHYLAHRHAWRIEEVCYLQDLYVMPEMRGTGLGRALIEAVYAEADHHGWGQVYWLTAEDNAVARQLYDRVGKHTPFIKYQRT